MRGLIGFILLVAVIGAATFFALTRTERPSDIWAVLPDGDPDAGALVFAAGGCASCHTSPEPQASEIVLTGGRAFASDFGTFYASNISADADAGIGAWTLSDFGHAVTQGVSPEGTHYFPAFPYTAYTKMDPSDIADLFAYMQTLPSDPTPSKAHDLVFPFNLRRGIGLWKRLYMTTAYHPTPLGTEEVERGRYLVEALAHCAECHTPRTALAGLDKGRWMQGAPDPAGTGRIPGITPAQLGWSEADLMTYLSTGFTPDYDSAGGDMVAVIENLAKLPESDRAAVAAYIARLPSR
jgi:mono/diheme cytochrome c family protein